MTIGEAILEQLAGKYADIEDAIFKMGDDELKALFAAADKCTETNCWFASYRVAQIIKPQIIAEQTRRAKQAIENAPKPSDLASAVR